MSDTVREIVEEKIQAAYNLGLIDGKGDLRPTTVENLHPDDLANDILSHLKDTESVEVVEEHELYCPICLHEPCDCTVTRFTVEDVLNQVLVVNAVDENIDHSGQQCSHCDQWASGGVIEHHGGCIFHSLCDKLNSLTDVPEQSFDEGLKEALADLEAGRYTTITTVEELHAYFEQLKPAAVPPELVEMIRMSDVLMGLGTQNRKEANRLKLNSEKRSLDYIRTLIEKGWCMEQYELIKFRLPSGKVAIYLPADMKVSEFDILQTFINTHKAVRQGIIDKETCAPKGAKGAKGASDGK